MLTYVCMPQGAEQMCTLYNYQLSPWIEHHKMCRGRRLLYTYIVHKNFHAIFQRPGCQRLAAQYKLILLSKMLIAFF